MLQSTWVIALATAGLLILIGTDIGTAVSSVHATAAGPERITLEQALARASEYAGQSRLADLAAKLAREDRLQTRAGLLPALNAFNQFIYTEGNGTASGVFVANDGVHVYNEQAVLHEDLLNVFRRAELRRSRAAEAVALAQRDVASRGLRATLVQDFYALVAAQRKVRSAQSALDEAKRFLDIASKQEHGGEAARADVIKAELQERQRVRDLSEASATLEKAKISLAVLIFPDPARDFSAVDDLDATGASPVPGAANGAVARTPDVRAATAAVDQARNDVAAARYAYFPSLALDFFYGIDANQFAARTDYPTPESGRSTLPDYLVPHRQNLGYSGQITFNIPVWNWGATRSKVRQAELREAQAQTSLTMAQKQAIANLNSASVEALTAQAQLESLGKEVDLAAESLRLALLRYEAGEATALEVSEAQTAAIGARNAHTDGLVRYRIALDNLETLIGQH